MEVNDVISQARDTLTVKRVFGEPYERNGVTVIPAARVQGGAGGGGGEGPDGQGKGSGGGFGLNARPVGAFLIRGDEVMWRLYLDVASVSRVGVGPGGPVLRTYNDTTHLPAE